MTVAGWLFMLISIGFVLMLFGYCITKLLTAPPPDDGSAGG